VKPGWAFCGEALEEERTGAAAVRYGTVWPRARRFRAGPGWASSMVLGGRRVAVKTARGCAVVDGHEVATFTQLVAWSATTPLHERAGSRWYWEYEPGYARSLERCPAGVCGPRHQQECVSQRLSTATERKLAEMMAQPGG